MLGDAKINQPCALTVHNTLNCQMKVTEMKSLPVFEAWLFQYASIDNRSL